MKAEAKQQWRFPGAGDVRDVPSLLRKAVGCKQNIGRVAANRALEVQHLEPAKSLDDVTTSPGI